MQFIINGYKKLRRNRLHSSFSYKNTYAFIGIGSHALDNLYPVLDYLHVPLKYVVSNSRKTADALNASSWNCQATNDLEQVLNDPEIKGVLIAVPAHKQYDLVKKALEKNKTVFVEKPPCQTKEELTDLIQSANNVSVMVGLQKRYAPACMLLKKRLKNVCHYTLHYRTGAYPEGDALFDLFIHPIDLAAYLFGNAQLLSSIRTSDTLFLHLQHENGIIGSVELSTAYSWQQAEEQLTVVEKNNIYELNGLSELLLRSVPARIVGVPTEKVLKYTPQTKLLFNAQTFIPSVQHNSLYVNGFYSEIKSFIQLCETGNAKLNSSNLCSLTNTYELLGKISQTHRNANRN